MNAKEYLNSVRDLDELIEIKKRELLKLREALNSPGVNEVRVKSSTVNDRMRMVDTIVDYSSDILREIARLVGLKKEVHEKIAALSKPVYVGLMTDYYINGATWEEIAAQLHISVRHVYRIHGNALNEFRKIYNFE